MPNTFLPRKGNYRNLLVYRKAECIFDLTYYFANRYYRPGDRTIDQMVQAARSGKQNIVEGSSAASYSAEAEIKLTGVARASLQELLVDYEDYLRVRGLPIWSKQSEKWQRASQGCIEHTDSSFYSAQTLAKCSAETLANIAIIMIRQEDVMLERFIAALQQQFLRRGGIREQMSRARRAYRAGEYINPNTPQPPKKPAEPTKPTGATESSGPTKPIGPTESSGPSKPTEPSGPTKPTEPSAPNPPKTQ